MTPTFFGLDLTASPKRPSAYATLDEQGRALAFGYLASDEEILSAVAEQWPRIVAIDAPLTLPLGLDCLEEACACQPASPLAGRSAERELARLGIGCYFTTKRSIIKQMVYRAIKLREALSALGSEVIEVYPYATKVRLFGKGLPPKGKSQGLEILKEHLIRLMPEAERWHATLTHDACDALLAAYTAYLLSAGETDALGDQQKGQIIIPKAGLIADESALPALTDEVILLDGYSLNDVEAHLAGEDEEQARRFGWYPAKSTEESVRNAILRWQREWQTGGPARAFATRDASSGELAGGCEVRLKDDGIAHMSYWTLSGYRRRGFATRAARLACDFAFAHLGVERMELYIAPDNLASRRVAAKAGFREEGLLRGQARSRAGRADMVLYARLATDEA